MWGLALHHAPHDGISSQNAVLFHNLLHRLCEPQLSDINTRAIQKVTYVLAWRGDGRC